MKFEEYFRFYISSEKKEDLKHFSKIRFWAITLLMVGISDIKIQMYNGHYLTQFDCFIELEDVLRGYKFEGGHVRAWWEQYQWLRGGKKPYWIE